MKKNKKRNVSKITNRKLTKRFFFNKHPKLVKVFFIIFLFSLLSSILVFYKNTIIIDYTMEELLEKDLVTVKPNHKSLNWKNVRKDFTYLAKKYKYLLKNEKNIAEDSPIWMMWYQGIKKAPPIVKACIQSVIVNRAKHPVYIITKYNINKYIKFPSYLIEKFKKRRFSITHFSDIVRFGLLYKYGGYWIDATYFVTTPITKIDTNFFTIKLRNCWLKGHPFINCKWSGNFLATNKNSFLSTFGYMAFLFYWKKYNSRIDYFLIDFIISIAYNKVKEFKTIVNKFPAINYSIFKLARKLKSIYKESDLKCPFNKLKKRKKYKQFINNKSIKNITNYGYIIQNYKIV